MVSKLDNHFASQSAALDLRVRRQQMIATNIANADTPHYKATDINFSRAFADALAGRRWWQQSAPMASRRDFRTKAAVSAGALSGSLTSSN